jgi:hypothetical protein
MISIAELRTLIDGNDDLRAIAESGDMTALATAVRPHLPPVQRTEPFMVTELILDYLFGFERACGILQTMDAIAAGNDPDQISEAEKVRYQIGRLKRLLVTKEIDANFGGSQTQLAGLVGLKVLTQEQAETWATLSYRAADPVSWQMCAEAVKSETKEGGE